MPSTTGARLKAARLKAMNRPGKCIFPVVFYSPVDQVVTLETKRGFLLLPREVRRRALLQSCQPVQRERERESSTEVAAADDYS